MKKFCNSSQVKPDLRSPAFFNRLDLKMRLQSGFSSGLSLSSISSFKRVRERLEMELDLKIVLKKSWRMGLKLC
jgi:hypothetical protein